MPSPYTYITDLPEALRQTLSPTLQQAFIDAFNAAYGLTNDELSAYQRAWTTIMQAAIPGEIIAPNTLPSMLPTNVVPQAPSASAIAAAGIPLSETKGYWVELSSVKLNDDDTSWIQAMPVGTWHHPKYGKIELTPEKIQQFAQNVNTGIRGQDLDIDYDHKEFGGHASGWVKAAQAKADGLWLQVQWTRKAAQEIKDRMYRYFSPEFVDEWEHPVTKQRIKNVLLGGALTNRPFLKGILPVNLSEVLSSKAHNDSNGGSMDWKEMAKLLGLPENTPEDQVRTEFAKRLNANAQGGNGEGENGNEGTNDNGNGNEGQGENGGQQTTTTTTTTQPGTQTQPENVLVTASDGRLTPAVLRLAEADPIVRALTERISVLETANTLSSIDVKLSELDNDPEYAVAPAVKAKLRETMVEAGPKLSDKIFETFKEMAKAGIGTVQLGEAGTIDHTQNAASATARIDAEVQKLLSANKELNYTQAVEMVSAQNPHLFTEYRNESYLKEGAR